jgi:PAS domain S-box-containing protein
MAIAKDLTRPELGAILKTALDAVVVMRLDGTIAGWNDVAERIFGWPAGETMGRRMSEIIIPPQHREAHERGLQHYLATGEGPVLDRHIEITAMHRDGREIPVELSITLTRQFDEPVFLGFLRDISERHEAQRRQTLMLAELNHRVKNMLAVVAGIAHQTARVSTSIDAFGASFSGRLEALARAQEMLTAGDWEGTDLGEVADVLIGPFAAGSDARVSFGGPPVELTAKQVVSVSMVLHELISNAAKYGALAHPAGHVALSWSWSEASGEGRVRMRWKESGLSGVGPPTRKGFGLKMIGLSAGHELGGTADVEWQPDGVAYSFEFLARPKQREN